MWTVGGIRTKNQQELLKKCKLTSHCSVQSADQLIRASRAITTITTNNPAAWLHENFICICNRDNIPALPQEKNCSDYYNTETAWNGSYLGKGANNGTLHDALEEDQVNVFGSCARWQFFQVVQHLLHSWGGKNMSRYELKEHQPLILLPLTSQINALMQGEIIVHKI